MRCCRDQAVADGPGPDRLRERRWWLPGGDRVEEFTDDVQHARQHRDRAGEELLTKMSSGADDSRLGVARDNA